MGFSRQEYWSMLPFPTSGDLPHPRIEPTSPELAGRFLPLSLRSPHPYWISKPLSPSAEISEMVVGAYYLSCYRYFVQIICYLKKKKDHRTPFIAPTPWWADWNTNNVSASTKHFTTIIWVASSEILMTRWGNEISSIPKFNIFCEGCGFTLCQSQISQEHTFPICSEVVNRLPIVALSFLGCCSFWHFATTHKQLASPLSLL